MLAGDGCLMEGISQEAISLAGHLKLNKLILFWDDNGISIDGPLSLSDSTDQVARFEASGWNAIRVDGHNPDDIATAIETARKSDRPTMIACKTTIGFGSPNKAGKSSAHGSPLGAEEIALTRAELGWSEEPFVIPADVRDAWRIAGLRSGQAHKEWEKRFEGQDAEIRAEFDRRIGGDLPAGFDEAMRALKAKLAEDTPTLATRKASEVALEAINAAVPETIGGSADLTGSNNTRTKDMKAITAEDFSGRFMHWGIREHGMAGAMNGMALHGGVIPYSGTFLVFTDYCRPSIRLAALMNQRVIHVMTHDSIGLGEDGPTHQPVEHLASLRAMPNVLVMRPGDAMETAECWQIALEHRTGPTVIALTRQNLKAFRTILEDKTLCAHGAYEIAGSEDDAKVAIFASGSEVEIALEAHSQLAEKGIPARVVSVPCMELFETRSDDYKAAIVGDAPVNVAVEAGVKMGWERFIGNDGIFVGMSSFGASGPYKELYKHFGITAEAIVERATARLSK